MAWGASLSAGHRFQLYHRSDRPVLCTGSAVTSLWRTVVELTAGLPVTPHCTALSPPRVCGWKPEGSHECEYPPLTDTGRPDSLSLGWCLFPGSVLLLLGSSPLLSFCYFLSILVHGLCWVGGLQQLWFVRLASFSQSNYGSNVNQSYLGRFIKSVKFVIPIGKEERNIHVIFLSPIGRNLR